eukprot:123323-Chlamydomonas_euryale.AAC.1
MCAREVLASDWAAVGSVLQISPHPLPLNVKFGISGKQQLPNFGGWQPGARGRRAPPAPPMPAAQWPCETPGRRRSPDACARVSLVCSVGLYTARLIHTVRPPRAALTARSGSCDGALVGVHREGRDWWAEGGCRVRTTRDGTETGNHGADRAAERPPDGAAA